MAPVVRAGTIGIGAGSVGRSSSGSGSRSGRRCRIWDGWVIAAIVLWTVAGGAGGQTGRRTIEGR